MLYTTGDAVSNCANGKPNSNAFIIEADWAPFGKADSWMPPWTNLRLGIQYTAYTQFNGGGKNYDGVRSQRRRQQHGVPVRLDGVLIPGHAGE